MSPYAGLYLPPPPEGFSPEAVRAVTHQLIRTIASNSLEELHALLTPSPPSPSASAGSNPPIVLINMPDEKGLAPLHYAVTVERPNQEVADALYRAGADMGLLTSTRNWTPLHLLARFAPEDDGTSATYSFARHVIQDLHAPLAACDTSHNTCIHIAAEHGESQQLLQALLDCDRTKLARDMRNVQG